MFNACTMWTVALRTVGFSKMRVVKKPEGTLHNNFKRWQPFRLTTLPFPMQPPDSREINAIHVFIRLGSTTDGPDAQKQVSKVPQVAGCRENRS